MTEKEFFPGGGERIARIRLMGETYHHEVDGEMVDCTDTLERLSQNTDYEKDLEQRIDQYAEFLVPLFEMGYDKLDKKLKKGQELTFEEAFSVMAYVSMGSNIAIYNKLQPRLKIGADNNPGDTPETLRDTIFLRSIALLSALSAKEGYVGLSAAEIAGLTSAVLTLDTITRVPNGEEIIGIGGMGGDTGYGEKGKESKLFSLSTLTALVLANMSYVHKHHSYPNTSKVAGQNAIEAFGARSDQDTLEALQYVQDSTDLLMTSAHTVRTIHTLSHRLRGETINHIIGPLAIPVSADTPVSAFIGVNDNVHPETVIEALGIMDEKGIQCYSDSVAFCGLDILEPENSNLLDPSAYYKLPELKKHIVVDEVAPARYLTLASFLVNGENMGSFLVYPEDFMADDLLFQTDFSTIYVPNDKEAIKQANRDALDGSDFAKSVYLAMSAALGIFTRRYVQLPDALDLKNRRVNYQYMSQAFNEAFEIISSGRAKDKLDQYVAATKESVH